MLNVTTEIKGNILTLTMDLSKSQGRSKSGKTEIVATTQGNVQVGPVKVGLTVYKS